MDSNQRKQFEKLLNLALEGKLEADQEDEFRALLRDEPEAMDTWLDHCQMEAWLTDPELRTVPTADKIIALGGSAPVADDSLKGIVSASSGGRFVRYAMLGVAAAAVLVVTAVAWMSLPEKNAAAMADAPEERPERPPRSNDDAWDDPEYTKEWKTIVASTGSENHPPVQEKAVPATSRKDRPIQFNRDIRPILSETCFHCHGPDEHGRRADLRLDIAAAAIPDADGWSPIIPGDAEKSEVWWRIITDDPDELMPPPESHMVLTDEQKDLLKRWIEEGAEYEGHWAFIPPARPEVPEVRDEDWSSNEIDQFVLARLEEDSLKPSGEADRRTLARRLYLDLTGLPPGKEEMDRFLADTSPNAWENLVDELLASPHFGERMAVQWLDQSRYADTNGYSIDGGRHMWLWRDWVIHAFNSNKPFDQFAIEQLAGDLLPDATQSQLIATGFNRNHMITHEGGTIPAENLVNYTADRVQTTSEIFLGLTMACAQCHDHKYDPISAKDYYRFFAYFNTLSDRGNDGNAGVNAIPSMMAVSPLPHDPEPVQQQLAQLKERLKQPRPDERQEWEADLRYELNHLGENLELHEMPVLGAKTPNRDVGDLTIENERLVKVLRAGRQAYTISAELPVDGVTGIRIIFEPDPETGLLGHAKEPFEGSFMVAGATISTGMLPSDEIDLYSIEPLKTATASASHPEHSVTNVLDERYQYIWTPHPARGGEQHLTLQFEEPLNRDSESHVTLMLNFFSSFGRENTANRFRLMAVTGRDDDTNISHELKKLLQVAEADRTPDQKAAMDEFFQKLSPAMEPLREEIADHERRLKEMTEPHPVMVMDTSPKPRETFILDRGDYASPTEKVEPGVPEVLPTLAETDGPSDRLDLARWLVRDDHPLMARVTVNRFWQMFFGTGIVATSADFGSQGEWPSHPELLDWLAVEFRESGWDTKALIRQIVTSSAYRQSSVIREDLQELDPANRLLARGPRFRLKAEFIRDGALKTSGLLNDWIGGASVKPGQPPNLWKEVSHYGSTPATAQVHVEDGGLDRHRRSLYTFWKRTVPPPNMAAFDAPNREVCVMQRSVTNTPLQALVLLNDPHFVEAANAFAQRIVRELPESSAEDRIRFAFEEALGRLPTEAEVRELKGLYEEQEDFTAIAQLILNLSETITRG